jgi:hypothetical protein
VVEDEAARLKVNSNHLRKARAFAHPKTGYDSKALDALCEDIETHIGNFKRPRSRFGTSHIHRLLDVPKAGGMRDEVQRCLFEKGWSTARLSAEVRRRCGRRRQGGRRKRIDDGNELLDRLEFFCEQWERWYSQINTVPEPADKTPIEELPASVRKLVPAVEEAIASLHKAVAAVVLPKPSKQKKPG